MADLIIRQNLARRGFRAAFGLLVIASAILLSATGSRAQDKRVVGQSETTVEHTLSEFASSVTFVIGHRCYGDNRPTQDSRRLIRFFDAAAQGFVQIETEGGGSELRWLGHRLDGLKSAEESARDLLRAPIDNRENPQDYVNAALAELNVDSNALEKFFPTGRPAGNNHEVHIDISEIGERRTRAISGCYTDAQLKELVAARAAAADRLIAASQGSGN